MCIFRLGMDCGCRKALRPKQSASLRSPQWTRLPTQRYASGLTDLGQEIPPPEQQTAEALAAHQKAEIEKWWPLIKAANIKAE